MKRTLKIAVPVAVAIMLGAVSFGGEEKVTICHYPPGNPENVQIITVGESALPAHWAHGDNRPWGGEATPECPLCGSCPGPGQQ